MYLAKVYITLKPTVNDPQGLTIKGALHNLGFTSIHDVCAGKYIDVKIAEKDTKLPELRSTRCAANCWQIPLSRNTASK